MIDDNDVILLRTRRTCEHMGGFLVDESKDTVVCNICNTGINPMWALATLAREESGLRHTHAELKKKIQSAEKRIRYKCARCGQSNKLR